MAPAVSTTPDPGLRESEVLGRMLHLYEQEKHLYAQVLDLSRQQGEALGRGASLGEIRRILEAKQNCLRTVRRLENGSEGTRRRWEEGRSGWSVAGRTKLNVALRTIAKLIEETLACEERNDQILLQQVRDL